MAGVNNNFKKGDRVRITETDGDYKLTEGDLATYIEPYADDSPSVVINTDKPNRYNHIRWDGYGIIVAPSSIELVSATLVNNSVGSNSVGGKWSEEEVDYLFTYYTRKPLSEIVAHLGRSYGAVTSKAHSLGLRQIARPRYTHNEVKALCYASIESVKNVDVAKDLRRTPNAIHCKLMKLRNETNFPVIPKESK